MCIIQCESERIFGSILERDQRECMCVLHVHVDNTEEHRGTPVPVELSSTTPSTSSTLPEDRVTHRRGQAPVAVARVQHQLPNSPWAEEAGIWQYTSSGSTSTGSSVSSYYDCPTEDVAADYADDSTMRSHKIDTTKKIDTTRSSATRAGRACTGRRREVLKTRRKQEQASHSYPRRGSIIDLLFPICFHPFYFPLS